MRGLSIGSAATRLSPKRFSMSLTDGGAHSGGPNHTNAKIIDEPARDSRYQAEAWQKRLNGIRHFRNNDNR